MTNGHKAALAAPRLVRSSEAIGWDGLVVRTYDEPRDMEQWRAPAMPGVTLVLITCGAMEMEHRYVGGPWHAQAIRQGDLFLRLPARVPYELRWHVHSTESMQTVQLHIDQELLLRVAEEVTGGDPARLAFAERDRFQDPLLMQIGLTLQHELEHPTPAGRLYAQAAAQLLAVHLVRRYTAVGTATAAPPGLTRQQVQQVADFVQAHLGQNLSLEVLAQQVGLSSYHFARVFRRATGESPHQFVLRQRIARARQLLKETQMPIAAIAIESGFAHQSHLTQVFKRYLGRTPRADRQD